MNKKIFIGNWKAYLTDPEAVELAHAYVSTAEECGSEWVVAAAPSFTALERVSHVFDGSPVVLASQDGFWEDEGAYTGEIPMSTLQDLHVRFVIVGHSEQRKYRGVTDEMVARQAEAAHDHDLTAVICVGETEEEKEAGRREEVVGGQVRAALEHVEDAERIIIAYEPRWAIGSGDPCSPEEAAEVHTMIAGILKERYGKSGAKIPILYGGSVDGDNIDGYLRQDLIGGVLVGGAGTDKEDLRRILCGS